MLHSEGDVQIKAAGKEDYARLMEIWESSVLATHHFLSKADFELFKQLIPTEFFPQLQVYAVTVNDVTQAFFSVSDNNLEMLFVDAASRGSGLGKRAVAYVVHQLHILQVDVNEQNEQAVQFYLAMGYKITGRSEKDGMGKPYPLLHLVYEK